MSFSRIRLFRSLALLALLDIPLSILSGSSSPERQLVALSVAGFAGYRYLWLSEWTYRLTFDYYLQLQLRKTQRRRENHVTYPKSAK
jgi:hypothetical protein